MIKHDIEDVRFHKSVTNIHADGDTRSDRLRQTNTTRYLCWEEQGWVWFKGRRTIKVPREAIAEMIPMTAARAKELGPCNIEYPLEAKK